MSETGDFESLAGMGPVSEGSEMSDEQFREQIKKAQAALKKLKKEEGKVKAQDNNLAQIIVQFLSQSGNTDLFLLISRAVSQDISSELILAIISLIDKKASNEVVSFLEAGEGESTQQASQNTSLIVKQFADFQSLSPEHKAILDTWIDFIQKVSVKTPHRILDTIIIRRRSDASEEEDIVKEVSPTLIQLSAFILRNYLTQHQIAFEFPHLYAFMQAVFVNLVKYLENQVVNQGKIES